MCVCVFPSAYTEAYKVCSMAVGPPAGLEALGGAQAPDPGQTSEDEDRGADGHYDRPVCTQNTHRAVLSLHL